MSFSWRTQRHDYEMSSNVGNWQWIAGCGCECGTKEYPEPIVDHDFARRRALKVFQTALQKGSAK